MSLFSFLKKSNNTPYLPEYDFTGNPDVRVYKHDIYGSKNALELILQGTALGDAAGQPFEGISSTEIPGWFIEGKMGLYKPGSHITDDTILSAATAFAMKNKLPFGNAYASYAAKYPAAYGKNFYQWMQSVDRRPCQLPTT